LSAIAELERGERTPLHVSIDPRPLEQQLNAGWEGLVPTLCGQAELRDATRAFGPHDARPHCPKCVALSEERR